MLVKLFLRAQSALSVLVVTGRREDYDFRILLNILFIIYLLYLFIFVLYHLQYKAK